MAKFTGGCSCGAIRFECESLGRASICHCRMCQRAFGSQYAPLVTAFGHKWVKGAPKYFQSSNKVKRGFCENCGTPISYEPIGFENPEISLGSFDRPELIIPTIQVGTEGRMTWFKNIAEIPDRSEEELEEHKDFFKDLVSYQSKE